MNHIMDKEAIFLHTIKEAYPNLEIRSARLHTTEGQFNDILFVNDDLLFRFPRYEGGINDLLQEIVVLQSLQGHLSLPIPNPIFISSGKRAVGNVFMGNKLLAGKPLFRATLIAITDEATLESLAQQLAGFLHGLHHLSPAKLDLDLALHDQLAESKTFFSNVEEQLFPFMRSDSRTSVTEHFENYFNNYSLHEYAPTPIHGDFGGSNILFEADKITGIIDFSFAGLDDPALDIAAVSTYGESFFARICRYYPNIHPLLERANFYRSTFALHEALHGNHNNDPKAFASGMEAYI